MSRRFAFSALVIFFSPCVFAGWGKDRLWNDKRAEVAVYDSERTIEEKARKFRENIITVKEDKVFKQNQIEQFETENYPQSLVTSVFVKEDPLQQVVKLTASFQDWLGAGFMVYTGRADATGGTLAKYTPSDGEANQMIELQLQKDDYFEDQLPLSLRELPFKEGLEKKIRVWDSLTNNRGEAPVLSEAILKVTGLEPVHCRAGSIPSWVVTLQRASGTDTYWFEKAEPNILVKMETHDGRKRLLYGRARWSYWDKRIPRPNVLK